VQRLKYTPVAFPPHTLLLTEPTRPPSPRTSSSEALRIELARYFPAGIRRAAHTRDSLWLPDPDKGSVPRSCTTRRASPLLSYDSSGILHLGASQWSPWPLAFATFDRQPAGGREAATNIPFSASPAGSPPAAADRSPRRLRAPSPQSCPARGSIPAR